MSKMSYSDYDPSETSGIYMRLEQGDNRVRIVSEPYKFKREFPTSDQPVQRYGWAVIDRADGELKYLEVGPMIFGQIVALNEDEDYGDPTTYDLKIKKTGEMLETRYTVIPGKIEELTREEVELAKTADPDTVFGNGEDIDPKEVNA